MTSIIKSRISIFLYTIWYCIVLIVNIVFANIHVARIVLSPKINILPETINIKTKLKSNLCRTVFANSITLTPGTLTIKMRDDILEIHCLDGKFTSDLDDSIFEKILLKIESVMK